MSQNKTRTIVAIALAITMTTFNSFGVKAAPPVNPTNIVQMFSAFAAKARAPDIAATTSTGTTAVALGNSAPVARVCNVPGGATAYVMLGDATVTVTSVNGIPIPPGTCLHLTASGATHIAGVTFSSSATIQTMLGSG